MSADMFGEEFPQHHSADWWIQNSEWHRRPRKRKSNLKGKWVSTQNDQTLGIQWNFGWSGNPFYATGLFSYPLKASENQHLY